MTGKYVYKSFNFFSHKRRNCSISGGALFEKYSIFGTVLLLKNSNTSISAATFKSYFYQNRKGWMNYVKRCNIFLISASNISSVKNQVCELLILSSYKFLFTSLFFAEVISPKKLGKEPPFIAFQYLETNWKPLVKKSVNYRPLIGKAHTLEWETSWGNIFSTSLCV